MAQSDKYLPSSRADLVASAASHVPTFQANGEFCGISPALIATVESALAASRAGNQEQVDAVNKSRLMTIRANELSGRLRAAMVAVNQAVNAKARVAADPASIYELAGLKPRATPATQPAPLTPTNTTATLQKDGTVSVTWTGRADNTLFTVQRRLVGLDAVNGEWVTVPFSGRKPLIDRSVPLGVSEVQYQVQANRLGQTSGWSEPARLRFGGSGQNPASLRIAA